MSPELLQARINAQPFEKTGAESPPEYRGICQRSVGAGKHVIKFPPFSMAVEHSQVSTRGYRSLQMRREVKLCVRALDTRISILRPVGRIRFCRLRKDAV